MFKKFKTMFDEPHEILGWVGMILILLAYGGISTLWIRADSVAYHVVNAVGALLLIYSTYKTKSYPVLFLNIIWLAIATLAIVSLA